MRYTVNKLAKISGISVRTLHFYDEIGLLKPAYYGDNKYRFYEEQQLLGLQQILFYRELGIPLNEIQKIIQSDSFNIIEALMSHKNNLQQSVNRTKKMIKTIDKTISRLKGEESMRDEELYYGFDSEVQKEHEKQLVERGIVSQAFMDECNQKIKDWTDDDKNKFINDGEKIMKQLITAIENKLKPEDIIVQTIMAKHFRWLELSWTPTRESYLGLTNLYQTPEFRVFFDDRHPKLLAFIIEAMKIYSYTI
jgi:DNA-binding transcriptional MerR regulator